MCAPVAIAAGPAAARASTILVLDRHGHVHAQRAAAAPSEPPPPRGAPTALAAGRRGPTVVSELKRLRNAGLISPDDCSARRADYNAAKRTVRRLSGTRRLQLAGVVADVDAVAAALALTPSRIPALWETLDRNREWWTTGPLLSYGRRVGFTDSELVWQFYPRHGIQIQWLGTFGKLNGLWKSHSDARAETLMDEALGLAVQRAGGIAWEYLFDFDGSRAPWVSGLAQGTGLQALTRTALRLGRADLMPTIAQGLGIFETPPPEGIRVDADGGARYLEYSGLPDVQIVNGFVQALVGLYDYAQLTGDPTGRALFDAGAAAARVEVPQFDTGAWSLYSRGSVTEESDLHYHVLLRDFLTGLCKRTADPVFCGAETHFTEYLSVPPTIAMRPAQWRTARVGRLRFGLSKISRVTVRVLRAGRVVQSAGVGTLSYGAKRIRWRAPRRPGTYDVEVSATDLAGNRGSASAAVPVSRHG